MFNKIFKNFFSKSFSSKNIVRSKDTDNIHIDDTIIDISKSFISKSLEDNINLFKELFKKDSTFIIREFSCQHEDNFHCFIMYIDGMINNDQLCREIINPIMNSEILPNKFDSKEFLDFLKNDVISCNDIVKSKDIKEILEKMLYGDTILFTDGFSEALIISTKGWSYRSISEPDMEIAIKGPREGFSEALLPNLSQLRRKLITSDLKVEVNTYGRFSNTKVALAYIDGIVNKDILEELKKRLNKINIDGILDVNYLEEFIKDYKYSSFNTVGYSERPDTIASKLLEGRIAIFVDGTPFVLTVPYLFIEYFHTSDDYYTNFYYATLSRFIRVIGFIVSISIPSLYLAFTTFHQEVLPMNLLISICSAKQSVPFPTFLEILVMLFVFEILREASTHMPPNISQAFGIVGGLVIGQAAVEAKLISAPVIIIIALSGITGLITPTLKIPVVIARIIFLLLTSLLGIYGFMFGLSAMILLLTCMTSFGSSYFDPAEFTRFNSSKDLGIRAPWPKMITRSPSIMSENIIRQRSDDSDDN